MNAKCEKCGAKPEPGVCLMLVGDLVICGECYHKIMEKQNELRREKWINGNY